ncbi:probable C-mannosyltransferase DPY19L1 [Penaeus monodon]|uniref:probable C-mannosyltransferase DPY19L1 n=1 Tax=Penaeus monodon TaxID=6687 RepID=UPI0018A74CB8|nr:probable C-mannosyltransferase DPY19L1 [Penaeus monodon]
MAAKHRRNADDERPSKNKRNNNPQKENGAAKPPKQEGEKRPSLLIVLICSICCGVVHSIHVSTMFENDRHFSHLSNLEREMTFRTEMGLYYSYYKTLVNADSFLVGLNRLMHDNLTEYPDTINTLQRFNLYPEVILGGTYRIFDAVTSWLGMEMRVCWQVSRGAGLSPVVSCEGLGDPAYWYLAGVWVSAGLTAALLFLQGVELSGSLLGGFITVLCFFFNHGEATRVQWTPPLRESFAFPWSIALNIGVTQAVRAPRPVWTRPLLLGTLTLAYLLCWQFAQFTVVAVVGIVYAMYTIGIIHPIPMLLVLLGTSYGFLNNVVLQFGNTLLVASPLAGCLLGVLLLYLFLEPIIQHLPFPTSMGVQLAFLFVSCAACKIELSRIFGVEDDAHIINILKAKFTNYSDFHTLLYTCSAEFDFLPHETVFKLNETLLIPCTALVGGAVLMNILTKIKNNMIQRLEEENTETKTPLWSGVDPGVVYNGLILAVYAVMASLIMRLKLFFTPQLCVVVSLLACKKYWRVIKKKEIHLAILAILVSGMCVRGMKNITEQRSIVGEYSNPELEELIEWIQSETQEDAVFAGPMAIMANVLLSTRRPIANHPHYEHAGLRERTKKVYSVYSRRSAETVYETLLSMKVNYVVLEETWCLRKNRPGCGMVDLWDVEEPQNRHKPSLCPRLFHRSPAPFHRVFDNGMFVVLQVPSRYVEIPPPRYHNV